MSLSKIFMVILLIFIFSEPFLSQSAKPQYNIRTERADTVLGEFTIELFPLIAPLHTAYFDSLVNIEFYDSTAFHRVVPDFVIQGGDPNSKNKPKSTWGEGDSSQATIKAEFSGVSHLRGILGAARAEDINSASSQFYINVADNPGLDWNYTAYGQVLEGMDVVDFIVNVPRDANDNPDEKIEMFVRKIGESNSIPEVPSIIRPENNAVGILARDTLMWNTIDDAVMYHVEIAIDESFDSLYLDLESGYSIFRIPELQLGNVQYYFRVKANNGGNTSEYSDVNTFYSSIEAPILIYPDMNEDSLTIQPTFSWYPVQGATGYRLQISRAPSFPQNRIILDVDTIKSTSFTPPPLEPNASHYWRVYSLTDQYQGPKSEFRRFVTPDVSSLSDLNLPAEYSLKQNYPNPFNPNTIVTYSLPRRGNVLLSIYNSIGELIKVLIDKDHNAGEYNITFNGSYLTSGVYYLNFRAEDYSKTIKLVLMK
ncbi:MAG: peptidylprolyl isomerase [Melioribacteraceae bacterium]|nr:peptidylprolyl isomerase [Melioribacteraceae bacterium]